MSATEHGPVARRRNAGVGCWSPRRSTVRASRPPYFERLLKLLRRKGRSQEDAEDIIQEALLRLHVYSRNTAVTNDESFLRHAVHNLSIDQYRRDRPDLRRKVPIDGTRLDTEWISVNPNLEQLVETRQHLDKIGALLEAASRRTREVFVTHRAGYAYAEIADQMNISRITVKRHMSRALQIVMAYRQKSKGEGHCDLGIDGPHIRVGIGAPKAGIAIERKYMIGIAKESARKGWSRTRSECASFGK